ncbi:MAG: DUF4124 domain-containing protein [Rhodoferax sp.]|nr:DUF4124 domain-containing protein [Rhodoferax sp.]
MAILNFATGAQRRALLVGVAGMLLALGVQAQGQTIFRCKNAAGIQVFSDRECVNAKPLKPVQIPLEADSPERKSEQDARVSRDKALADQLQARRMAYEQAGRAAQDQQMQVNRAIADKFEQERNLKNSAVTTRLNDSVAPLTVP